MSWDIPYDELLRQLREVEFQMYRIRRDIAVHPDHKEYPTPPFPWQP